VSTAAFYRFNSKAAGFIPAEDSSPPSAAGAFDKVAAPPAGLWKIPAGIKPAALEYLIFRARVAIFAIFRPGEIYRKFVNFEG
jgi:hypothetical protein